MTLQFAFLHLLFYAFLSAFQIHIIVSTCITDVVVTIAFMVHCFAIFDFDHPMSNLLKLSKLWKVSGFVSSTQVVSFFPFIGKLIAMNPTFALSCSTEAYKISAPPLSLGTSNMMFWGDEELCIAEYLPLFLPPLTRFIF